jgi:hypothetical protein
MEKPEVIEIIESELQASEKINVFKKYIYTLRYPNISKEVEILTNLKNKIKTPGFKLDFPIDKESNKSNITFQFRNYEELEKKVNSLNKLLENEALKEILEEINNR